MELGEMNCKVKPIQTKDYPTLAKRPHYSVLNKVKIKTDFKIEIPYWRDSLKECIEKIKKLVYEKYINYRWSWFYRFSLVRLLVNKYPEYHIINMDVLTYAGNLENLKDIEDQRKLHFYKV